MDGVAQETKVQPCMECNGVNPGADEWKNDKLILRGYQML